MNLSRLLIESINDDPVSQLKVQYSQDLTEKLSKLPENGYLKFLHEHIDEADISSIICVQIPSYKDIDVINTVNSLLVNAVNPDRIRIKIFFQDDDVDLLKQLQAISNVEVKHIPSYESQGLCYARYQCNLMMDDDTDFAMHIDSHMRCAKFWDVALILSWQLCNDDKAIVSQRPFDFSSFYNEPLDSDKFIEETHHCYMKLIYQCYEYEYYSGILPKPLAIYPDDRISSRQSACISGGLTFGKAEMDRLVPSDPNMYFVADENSMAIRYWTHGFNIYSPDYYFIYHCYFRSETIKNNVGLDVDLGHNRELARQKRESELGRMKALFSFNAEVNLGDFGLGTERTFAEYEHFAGVNFEKHTIARYALEGDMDNSLQLYSDDDLAFYNWNHNRDKIHIGICYIATSDDKQYFEEFLNSLQYFYSDYKKTVVVISDGLAEWNGYSRDNVNVVLGTPIHHFVQPILSLSRMQLILDSYNSIFTHMCYFNAKSVILPVCMDKDFLNFDKFNVSLHSFGPDYDVFASIDEKLLYMAYLKNDTYEYVQSNFFLAPSYLVLEMCKSVNDLIDKDISMNRFALWCDESYLNKWCTDVRYAPYVSKKYFGVCDTVSLTPDTFFVIKKF